MDIQALLEKAGLQQRPAQLEMIELVAEAFSQAAIKVIEAPTATGKSFAYILGALKANQMRTKTGLEPLTIVVSTATVALQEQLYFKDLPFIADLLGEELQFQLAKGRNRYICLRNLYGYDDAEPTEQKGLDALEKSLEHGWTGDFDQLKVPPDWQLLQKIHNTSAGCGFSRCEFYDECPFFKARQGLRKAKIIVTNHNLLLSHLKLGDGAILPEFDQCAFIIDECHHLPSRVLDAFSFESPLLASAEWINSIDKLFKSLPQDILEVGTKSNWQAVKASFLQQLIQLQPLLERYYQSQQTQEKFVRVTTISDEILAVLDELKTSSTYYLNQCKNLRKAMDDFAEKSPIHTTESMQRQYTQLGVITEASQRFDDLIKLWRDTQSVPPIAKWMQPLNSKLVDQPNDQDMLGVLQDYKIFGSPVAAAHLLKMALWDVCQHGVVLCSATVRSLGRFERFINSCGLKNLAITHELATPLSYHQSSLIVPRMRTLPNKDPQGHIQETINLLNQRFLEDIHEGVMVLFTSKYAMEQVYDGLSKPLQRITLVQGDMSKQAMLDMHRRCIDQFKASIIFGVDSLAEGVDLPGAYLTRLIIHKLPFLTPSDPIEQTRSDWLKGMNMSPFNIISLPQASLKLTQMVGRLIRTEKDVGEVIILDRRVVSAGYGQQLLNNLPAFQRIIE